MTWEDNLRNIEDRLFPRMGLDVWERIVYYHLLRRTRVEGLLTATFGVRALALEMGISETRVRETIRSLHDKGAIKIERRSAKGHDISVFFPEEIGTLYHRDPAQEPVDLASIDVFTDRKHVDSLLARESGRCFYCLREVTRSDCALDHVSAQMHRADHSFRNVVVACHSCNSLKQGEEAETFLRSLYRRGILTGAEFEARIGAIKELREGKLVPKLREA